MNTIRRQKNRGFDAVAAVAAVAVLQSSASDVCVKAFAPQHLQVRGNAAVPSAVGSGRKIGSIQCALRMSASIEDMIKMDVDETSETNSFKDEADNNMKQAQASSQGLGAIIMEKIGTVDESRLVFPEVVSGEVPRLFSNLEYTKCEEGKVSAAAHVAGSTVGAAALIAGSTIGAGVLALPTATAPVGFLPSSAALIVAWGYMVVSGLLISELAINRIGETGRPGVGLVDLYKSSLGKKWAVLGSTAYLFLHYAVMVAYVAQGGVNLDMFFDAAGLGSLTSVPGFSQIAFASVIGASLFFATPSIVEKVNNVLVVGAGATFLGIIAFGAGSVDFGSIVALENQHPELVVNAFPILFLSLVYHNVVPTVVTQLEGDKEKITKAIIVGTAVPLLMFLAWNAVVLGNIAGAPGALTGDIDPVALLQGGDHGGPMLGTLVGCFSELAVATSLIAFIYGTVDALTDVFGLPTKGPAYEQWKPALYVGTLLPPLALALGNPDIFYDALDYGGAFGVSTLFLVLPPIMVWKQRYSEEGTPLTVKPMVPFGKIPLGSLWKAAATLIVEQGAEKLGIIEYFKHLVGEITV